MLPAEPRQRAANVVSAVLRIAVAAVGLVTVVVLLVGGGPLELLTFTLESNLMVAVSFLWTAVTLLGRWRTPPEWLAGSAVFYLVITGAVYNFVLRPEHLPSKPDVLFGLTNNTLEHVVTPIAALAIWAVFAEHRRISWKYVGWWLVYLVLYLLMYFGVLAIRSDLTSPYPFLDTDLHGVGGVAWRVALYMVGFAALAAALIGLDRLLPSRTPISELDPRDPRNRASAR